MRSGCRRRGAARPRSPQSSRSPRVRSSGSRRLSRPGAAPSGIAPGRRRRSCSSSTSRARWQPPQALDADAPGPGARRRRPAARRRADGAGGSRRADRPGPSVSVPDARRARVRGDPRPLGHIESPPPQQVSTNATSFEALTSLARDGFFTRRAAQRTCVLVTDGETRSYSRPTWSALSRARGAAGCWSSGSAARRACLRRRRLAGGGVHPRSGRRRPDTRARRGSRRAGLLGGGCRRPRPRRCGERPRSGPTGRQQTSRQPRRSLPTPQRWRAVLRGPRPASSCVSANRGCTGSSRKRKIQPCGSPTRRLCRADSGGPGAVTASVASSSRDSRSRQATGRLRPDAGQQPPLAADPDHAGERRRNSSASTTSTSRRSIPTSAEASSRIRSRSAAPVRDDERRQRLRPRRRDRQGDLAVQAAEQRHVQELRDRREPRPRLLRRPALHLAARHEARGAAAVRRQGSRA